MVRWEKEEIYFLKENYSKLTNKEIQSKIKRSRKGIIFMASKLGLRKSKETNSRAKKKLIFMLEKNS